MAPKTMQDLAREYIELIHKAFKRNKKNAEVVVGELWAGYLAKRLRKLHAGDEMKHVLDSFNIKVKHDHEQSTAA